MFDFGWAELLIIGAVVIFVIGPDDIPKVMVGLGRMFRRLQYMRYAFTQQFDDFMRDADMSDISEQVNFEARAPKGQAFDESGEDEDESIYMTQSYDKDVTQQDFFKSDIAQTDKDAGERDDER